MSMIQDHRPAKLARRTLYALPGRVPRRLDFRRGDFQVLTAAGQLARAGRFRRGEAGR